MEKIKEKENDVLNLAYITNGIMDTRTSEERQYQDKIDKIISEIRLRDFLHADSYQVGERSALRREMTDRFFFQNFYADTEKAEEMIRDLQYEIEQNGNRNIVLYGYVGCGKTTFTHYWMRTTQNRSIIFEFDKYISSADTLKRTMVGVINDFVMTDIEETGCKVVESFIELFRQKKNNSQLGRYDVNNNILYMIDKFLFLKKICDGKERYEWGIDIYVEKDIKAFIADHYSIQDILQLIVMWDVAQKKANHVNSPCYFIFENLDTLYETEGLKEMVTEIGNFRSNLENIFENMEYDGMRLCEPSDDYYFIFIMRDTTKAEFNAAFNEHFSGQKISLFVPKESLTFNYAIDDIIEKKINYIEQIKKTRSENFIGNCPDIYERLKSIRRLLRDEEIKQIIFSLFNNDMRIELDILEFLVGKDSHTSEKYRIFCDRYSLRQEADDYAWSKYGSRCIVYRGIFDYLDEHGFLDTLKKHDFEGVIDNNEYAVNIPRMILIYLQNSSKALLYYKYKEAEREYVSIYELIKGLSLFCKDENKIVNALWEMYDLRKQNGWNHLVTFDQMKEITRDKLKSQIHDAFHGIESEEQIRLRITLAGITYINKVLTHYEYFAARCKYISEGSLFSWEIGEILNYRRLTNYLESVKAEAQGCCKRLFGFSAKVLSEISELSGSNYLSSKFAHQRIRDDGSRTAMFHGERIIHSQINYVDALRLHVLKQFKLENILDASEEIILYWLMKAVNLAGEVETPLPIRTVESFLNSEARGACHDKEDKLFKITVADKNTGKEEDILIDDASMFKCIRIAINFFFIDRIEGYISFFGISHSESQCAQYSAETQELVQYYELCMEHIKMSRYENINFAIDRINGKKLLKRTEREV